MADYSPDLPVGSVLNKSYEYGIEVHNGPAADSVTAAADSALWLPVRRVLNLVPNMTPVTQTAQTYDDKGSDNNDVTAWNFSIGFAAYVNRSATTGEPVPELKVLQLRVGDTRGEDAKVGVRWYHKPSDGSTPDPNESFRGIATVAYTRNNAGADGANEQWGITLTGVGPAVRIANPFDGWADDTTIPFIASILPAGQSIGEQVTITGTEFDGATAVTIDGVTVPVETWELIGSTTIVAEIPAGATGVSPVIVTTPAGASVAVNYTVV